jgi:uncharacterized membrane protein
MDFILSAILIIWLLILTLKVSKLTQERKVDNDLFVKSHSENITNENSPISYREGDNVEHDPFFDDVPEQSIAHRENNESTFVNWLKENWIMKLGALLLLIGFGWLATYAFMNNWIGDTGRILLGIGAGLISLVIGSLRINKNQNQGEVFLALGSGIILLTTFAARVFYGFFDPLSSLVLMFMSIVFVAFVGVKYKSKYLPLISLILAGVAPLLTHSSSADYITLFTYLLVVVLGVIWVVFITGQRSLVVASLILVFLYSIPCILTGQAQLLPFAYIFTIIFFMSNIISILKLENTELEANVLTAGISSLFLLVWVLGIGQEEFKSLILASWMIVFSVGAFLVFRRTQRKEPFYVYALSSIVLLAAATAIELKGEALLLAYTIESMIISIAAYLITNKISIAKSFTILLVGPIILSFPTFMDYISQGNAFSVEFFSILVLIISMFLVGLFFWNKAKELNLKDRETSTVWINLGAVYSYLLIWNFFQKIFDGSDIAITVSLILFTLIGLSLYLYGIKESRDGFRIHGQILVGLIVVRLILVDISHMQIGGKIITFLLIGALLISTAFLEKNRNNKTLDQ